MIEQYIEKDIMRQVKVLEYVFEMKKIYIQEIAEFLEVSRGTVKRDIEQILFLIPDIFVIENTASVLIVQFNPTVTRYQLIKRIYSQSQFLRVCTYYLWGDPNYMKIVEKEHISVAKAFGLKKKAEQFFIESEIMDASKEFLNNEFTKRLIMLTVWMRIDLEESQVDIFLFLEAEKIVRRFTKEIFTISSEREVHFFKLAIYLSLKRKKESLVLSQREIAYAKRGFYYQKIKSLLSNYQLKEEEIVYISMLHRLLNKNLTNYQYLILDHDSLRKPYLESIYELETLIYRFEKAFDRELLKDVLFEKPFLRYILLTFIDRQVFLVEKHLFLNQQQRELGKKIENIMTEWIDTNKYNILLSKKATDQFCLQVADLLLNNLTKKWHVFFVASDEFSHIAYREWLQRNVNTTYIIVDNVLYYSLEELPIYINTENSIIICERSLMNLTDEKIRQTKTFPISLISITQDLTEFFRYIFH
ncbi:HTH domain-containing protein [Enterococcus faecalis]|uniref:helix-turn-helix domain-containing protein n=1 Tax=Enterococcus faecalis TaxID=1351 RepID=UPI001A96A491|nr:helix-turn-helix domain-containing protein [Enterococcus faecalis]MBO1104237.1 HTH domain-containing protein [Enterococcus faecalis]